MGKRKKSSRKPQGPKKQEPLATTFTCLFCNHEKSVTVKIDRKAGTGHLNCKVCGQTFQTGVNYLSAGVDVYADWIDACDAVSKGRLQLPSHLQRLPAGPDRSGNTAEHYAEDIREAAAQMEDEDAFGEAV